MEDLRQFLQAFKGRKVLMVIYPHPDDETMAAGGLLMVAKRLGYQTVVVCLTEGEAGQNYSGSWDRRLADIRREELNRAGKILGVDVLEHGDFGDGKLRGNEKGWSLWVSKQLKKYDPGIVVTYDHSGNTGHPDHIILSVRVLEIVKRMKKPPVFLWTSLFGIVRRRMLSQKVAEFGSVPNFFLDLGWKAVRKGLAARAHRSQKPGKDLPVPLLVLFLIFRREWYYQVDLKKNYPYEFVDFQI